MLFSMMPIDFASIVSQTGFGIKILETKEKENQDQTPQKLHSTFRLPIEYLDKSEIHELSPIVAADLELIQPIHAEGKPIYDYLFQTKHSFAKNVVSDIGSHYTTNKDFLKDTQEVIRDSGTYLENMKPNADYSVPCDSIMEIWKDLKEDADFLDKYSYMEWSMLKHMNESSTFLQCLSVISIVSPLFSLILPLLFLIFPFVILKLKGIPVTFSVYLDVLKEIAKNHFIGKIFTSFSWDRIGYLLLSAGLYAFQIYQNVTSCLHYYENIKKMNTHLFSIKNYLTYSISSMENFLTIHKNKCFYWHFCQTTEKHLAQLKVLHNQLKSVNPFQISISTFNQLGHMMKCFYDLHANVKFEESLRYSIGFEGYIQNLLGVYENLVLGHVNFTHFEADASGNIHTHFEEQFYPVLKDKKPVTNHCNLSSNIILSGPNASGKTTILKTTLLNILFSQQWGVGFFKSGTLLPYTHIHSYLNIPDTSERDSLFQSESRRCKEILDIIKETSVSGSPSIRHFCIFDELYSGTNVKDATKSGFSFLQYLSKIENVDFILTTHYNTICEKLKKHKRIQNYKMMVENQEDGTLKYTYKMKKGISKVHGGINILKDMNYPEEIIQTFNDYDKP